MKLTSFSVLSFDADFPIEPTTIFVTSFAKKLKEVNENNAKIKKE